MTESKPLWIIRSGSETGDLFTIDGVKVAQLLGTKEERWKTAQLLLAAAPPPGTLAEQVLRSLVTMTPEERVKFFDACTSVYCRECGYEHPKPGYCQCTNDE